MSDDPRKKRMARAKKAAVIELRRQGFDVFISDNKPVCVIGNRSTETKFVRVVLDDATADDFKAMKSVTPRPGICSREVWRRKNGEFKIYVI
jgi:hypothetical protein